MILPALIMLLWAPPGAASAIAFGDRLEQLTLLDAAGAQHRVALPGRISVVMFVSAQCPVSNAYNDRMIQLFRDYSPRGVQFIFVNANFNETVAEIESHRRASGFPFPVYRDPDSVAADRLGATVTPEAFLFDSEGKLLYRGHIDDSRNPARIKTSSLRLALDQALAGRPVLKPETKAFGCTIKRKKQSS